MLEIHIFFYWKKAASILPEQMSNDKRKINLDRRAYPSQKNNQTKQTNERGKFWDIIETSKGQKNIYLFLFFLLLFLFLRFTICRFIFHIQFLAIVIFKHGINGWYSIRSWATIIHHHRMTWCLFVCVFM